MSSSCYYAEGILFILDMSLTATGDLNNAIGCLLRELTLIKFTPDVGQIRTGGTSEYMRLYQFLLMDYDSVFATHITANYHIDLSSSVLTDREFVAGLYRILREEFEFKIPLTHDKFLQDGFAVAVKALSAAKVITAVRSWTAMSASSKRRSLRSSPLTTSVHLK
ncbi:hypothetical protein ACOME3_002561 [Neoechinorhynchus agilis]